MERLEGNKPNSVPFIVYESATARLERTIKRLWVLCIVAFLAFVISNGAWIVYENSFEDTVVTQEVDTGNGAAAVSGTGDVHYGENQTGS